MEKIRDRRIGDTEISLLFDGLIYEIHLNGRPVWHSRICSASQATQKYRETAEQVQSGLLS